MTDLSEYVAMMSVARERPRSLFLPTYTPRNWWECDGFELTESGYFREYELKLSVADFRADAKKCRIAGWREPNAGQREVKHHLLAAGDVRGPVEFYYVTPVGLLKPESLPAWAGLIELHDRGPGHRPSWRWIVVTKVKAPRLHSSKADPKLRSDVLKCCYYRFHRALTDIVDRTEPRLVWNDEPPPQLADVA